VVKMTSNLKSLKSDAAGNMRSTYGKGAQGFCVFHEIFRRHLR
jgi:hypothetical protein